MIVYEAKKMSERAPGVGKLTNISIIDNDGINDLDQEKIDKLKDIYAKGIRLDETWEIEFKQSKM